LIKITADADMNANTSLLFYFISYNKIIGTCLSVG